MLPLAQRALHLLALGDVDEDVGRADQAAGLVLQRPGVGEDVAPAAVRPHDDDLAVLVRPAVTQRQRHPARVVGHRRIVGRAQRMRAAIALVRVVEPRAPAPQLSGTFIEMDDPSFGVASVGRHRKRVQ